MALSLIHATRRDRNPPEDGVELSAGTLLGFEQTVLGMIAFLVNEKVV